MLLRREGGVPKKRERVLKKRGRVLKEICLVRGPGGGPLPQKGAWLLRKRGRVLKSPVEVLSLENPNLLK